MIRGIETALRFIPKLRTFAEEHFSEHCKNALVKAGLYEGAGCQMCATQRGSGYGVLLSSLKCQPFYDIFEIKE